MSEMSTYRWAATRSTSTRRWLRTLHLAMEELIDLILMQFERNRDVVWWWARCVILTTSENSIEFRIFNLRTYSKRAQLYTIYAAAAYTSCIYAIMVLLIRLAHTDVAVADGDSSPNLYIDP